MLFFGGIQAVFLFQSFMFINHHSSIFPVECLVYDALLENSLKFVACCLQCFAAVKQTKRDVMNMQYFVCQAVQVI